MKIKAVRNNVIFQFTDETLSRRFVNSSKSGILIAAGDVNQSTERWALVTHVGPDVTVVEPGEYVLIEGGKWTNSFYVEDVRYWKTDEDQLLLASDEPGEVY